MDVLSDCGVDGSGQPVDQEDTGKKITHVMMLFLPSPRGLLPWSTRGIFRGTEFPRALTLGPWPFYVYLDES